MSLVAGGHPRVVVGALVVWAVSAYHRGATVMSPARPQIRTLLHSAAVALAAVSIMVGLGVAKESSVADTVLAIAFASAVASAARLLRRRMWGPVRVLALGDRVAVTGLSSRWLKERRVDVVGVCVVEPDLDDVDLPADVLGAPVVTSIDDVPAMADRLAVDAVVVTPVPGFTTVDFRRLAWSLDDSRTALGVVGVLDSVAPHRVAPGRLGGSLVMDVGPARQSAWTRTTKAVVDRVAGTVLLVACAPLLAGLWLAVRLDNRGPGLFAQTRVGENGRLFTMYKLRTMCVDAEAVRQHLLAANGGDTQLFKLKDDPRVTRMGRFLRRFSLDELPQLVNIVKGDMSLVGPRPALPEEVATYTADERRRLAVKPGLTGQWQVSGRSDLSWEESVGIDMHYVDNWRLSDDLLIGVRTVEAVVRSRGAY